MTIEYLADVQPDGSLKIRGRKQFDNDIKESGWKVVKIVVTKHKAKRSLSQNAFYHACVVPVLQQGLKDIGHNYSLTTVHEMMKAKFLREDILLNEHGEYITRIKSTTELNKEQFGEYIEQISVWSIEYLNTVIPAPNTQTSLVV